MEHLQLEIKVFHLSVEFSHLLLCHLGNIHLFDMAFFFIEPLFLTLNLVERNLYLLL